MLYFVYDGEKALMKSEQPSGNTVGTVKWRDENIIITLIYTLPFQVDKVRKTTNSLYPLLKSNLQKQIRRKEIEAVTTCNLMLDLNDFECLRRLSVIAAEDVEITKETSVIVWLMSALSKSFSLSAIHKQFILSYVANLVNHPICRRLEIGKLDGYHTDINEIMNSDYLDKEILAGVLFRISYGGLKGDLPMISSLCGEVLKAGRRLSNYANNIINYDNVELKFSDAAVDFHIYPHLCELISKDTNIDPELVKRVIWTCSSGINYRYHSSVSKNSDYEVWAKISQSFYLHTKTYLYNVVKKYF